MSDSDQWKLSAYWHNEYNRAWHTLETMQSLSSSGVHIRFCAVRNRRGERGLWFEILDDGCRGEGIAPNLLDAFWKAKDEFDLCRKVGPGDSADQSSSDEAA